MQDRDEEHKRNQKNHIRRKRGKSNKKINFISYWKLSDYDCYTLCLNTRSQIRQMAEDIQLSQPKVFFFWHRMFTYCSYEYQSTLFGVGASTLHKWFHQTRKRLLIWSNKCLIYDGTSAQQFWTTNKIVQETPQFVVRIHGTDSNGTPQPILTMDGTYVATQNTNEHHGLRHLMWSGQKKYTLCKPHLICTLNGTFFF